MNAYNLRLLTVNLAALTTLLLAPLKAQDNFTSGDAVNNPGSWSAPLNWSSGVPGTSSAVVITVDPPVSVFYGAPTILEDTDNFSGDTIASLSFGTTNVPLAATLTIAQGDGVESLIVNGAITNFSPVAINLILPMNAGASATYAGGPTGGSLNFGKNLDLQGNAITMTGTVTVEPVTNGPAQSLLNDSVGGGTLTIGTVATPGTVTLAGANTFGTTDGVTPSTGSTLTIVNGTPSVPTLAAVGTVQPLGVGGAVTLSGASASAPGILQYTGGAATLAQNVTVTTGDFGTISNTGGGLLTLSGAISKNGSVLNLSGCAFNVTGQITGSSAGSDLNVIGASTVTLSNTNSYNGPTSVSGGSSLITAIAGALPTPTFSVVTLGAASDTRTTQTTNTLDLDGTAQTIGGLSSIAGTAGTANFAVINQVVNSNGTSPYTTANGTPVTLTISPATGVTNTFAGSLGGTGASNNFGVTLDAADSTGVQVLSGTNTYTGATTITVGTLQVNGSLASGSTVGVGTAGTLSGSGTVNGSATLTGNGIINFTNPGNIVGTLTVTGGNWNGAGTVAGQVTQQTSGTFTIGSGANLTATTGLNVTGGSIASGSSTSTITGSVDYTSSNGSTFGGVIAGAGNTLTVNTGTSLTLGGTNTYTGATTITAGTLAVNGSIAAGSTVGVGTAGTLSGSGTINGNATLTGGGAINLTNPGMIAGTLVVTGGNWNGAGTVGGQVTSSSGTFTIASGANLTATTGVNVTGGSIASASSSSTITANVNYTSAANSTFAGVIAGAGKTVLLNNAAATLTLSGANTYTGATTLTAGTLVLSGSGSLGNTAVSIANGAALDAQGATNTIGGAITLDSGGIINLQDSATNILDGSTLTVATGTGTLSIDVGSGSTSDLVHLSGAATLTGAVTVNVDALSGATAGTQYTFVSASGGLSASDFTLGTLTGTLAGDTATFSGSGTEVTLTINATNGYFYTGAANTVFSNVNNYNTSASGLVVATNPITSATNIFIGTTSPTPTNITPAVTSNIEINSLTFTPSGSGALISGGSTLTIDNGVTVQTGVAGTETITAPVALGSSQTWTVTDADSTLLDSGGISDGVNGPSGLTKAGAGTLTLQVANSYSGATVVSAGALNAANADALAGTSSITVTGGALQLSGGNTFTFASPAVGTTLNGSGISGAGALESVSGVNTYGSLITLGSNATIGSDNGSTLDLTNTGTITGSGFALTLTGSGDGNLASIIGTGAGGLTMSGSGIWTLTGANTFTGATTINAGTLALGAGGGLMDSSGINLAGGSAIFDILAAGNQTINDLAGVAGSVVNLGANGLTAGTANSTAFAGSIEGTGGSLTKVGTGTLTLSGTNTYTGATTVNDGTLQIGNGTAGSIANGSAVTVASGATLAFDEVTGSTQSNTITDNGTVVGLGAGNITLSGMISGSGGFTQTGAGITVLAGADTYVGATTVSAGIVELTGSISNSSAVSIAAGAGIDLAEADGSVQSNAITDNGSIDGFESGGSTNTLSGIISGTGGVLQAEAGTTVLAGADAYTGSTMVLNGALQIGNGATGSISNASAVSVSGGATLVFDEATGSTQSNSIADDGTVEGAEGGGVTNTLSGPITGAGGFTQTGAGTTILSGANGYGGNTLVSAGTLQVGNGSAGSISNSSAVSVSGGATLAFDEANGSTQSNAITDDGTVTSLEGAGITNTLSGPIDGGGGFTQTGAGTTILSGTNGYTGATTVSAGTLSLTGALSATSGVTTSGTGVFSESGTGSIGGGATFTQGSSGTSVLGGTNAYAGVTAVNAGTLSLTGALSATSGVTTSGTGVFSETGAGSISGGATFAQGSSGASVLSGANSYTGGTTISAGTLLVGNSGALGTGAVTQSGGNLGTSGAGGIQINMPTGYMQSGGTLTLQLNATADPVTGLNAANDLVNVTGSATLDGTLAIKFNFVPAKNDVFTVITTTTGIMAASAGYIMPIISPAGYVVQGSIINGGDDFSLDVTSTQFALTGLLGGSFTPNRAAILNYIDQNINSSTDAPLNQAITQALAASASEATVVNIADQMNPEKFANFARSSIFNNAVFSTQLDDNYFESQRSANGDFMAGNGQIDSSNLTVAGSNVDPSLASVSSRLLAWSPAPLAHGLLSDSSEPVVAGVDMKEMKTTPAPGPEHNFSTFIAGNVVLGQDFSQTDLAHADTTSGGVQLGADYRVTPHLRVGALFGYNHTDGDLDDNGSKATIDSYAPGAYATFADKGWYANAVGTYGFNNYTEDRHLSIGGASAVAHGAPDGDQITGDLDGGYDFHVNKWTFGPLAGVQYTHLDVNSFSEDGAGTLGADESVNQQQTDSLRSRMGGHVSYVFQTGKVLLTPHLDAAWQHEFMDQGQGINAQIVNVVGTPFTVKTPNPSRDSALIDCGLNADLNGQVTVFGDYLVQAGQSNYFGQSVQAGIRIGF